MAPAPQLTPAMARHAYLLAELMLGNARPYIELLFKIKAVNGALVPMKFLPLQVKYQEAMFGGGWKPGQPRDGTWAKARKATVSAWATATDAAYFFGMPGFDVAVIANSDKTLAPLSSMVDTFYENMPVEARPQIYKQKWGTEMRQVCFVDPGTGETIINTMVMSSSNSPNFGRGYTIRIVHLDELAFFVNEFDDAALQNSVGGNAIWFRISTANGQDKRFYPAVQAAKKREVHSQVYIFFEWWQNPENWYGEEDENRRSEDWGKTLTPGEAEGLPFELVRDEALIVERFPEREGMSRERAAGGYLAFRRRKLADALKNKAGDSRAAQSAFFQEYPEDDVRPFQNLINPIFDSFLLDSQLQFAKTLPALSVEGVPAFRGGMRFRAFRRPVPGHSYAGGLDYSAMKGRDAAAMPVKDLTTGEYVAEIYGNQGSSVPDVTAYGVQVMTAYNYGLLIPETNNMGRTQGNFARYDLGYENVYRRPAKAAEDPLGRAFLTREWGFETGEQSRKDMIVAGMAHYNAGDIRILIPELALDMQSWNPEQIREGVDGTKKHFPDRLSGFFLIEVVNPSAHARGRMGLIHGEKRLYRVGGGAMPFPSAARG